MASLRSLVAIFLPICGIAIRISLWLILNASCRFCIFGHLLDTLLDITALGCLSSLLALLSACCLPRKLGRLAQLGHGSTISLAALKLVARLLELPPVPADAHSVKLPMFSVALGAFMLWSLMEMKWSAPTLRSRSRRPRDILDSEGNPSRNSASQELVESSASDRSADRVTSQTSSSSLPTRNAGSHVHRLLGLVHEHRGWVFLGCLALFLRLPCSLAVPGFVSRGIGATIDFTSQDPAVRDAAASRAQWAVIYIFLFGIVDSLLDFWNFFLFVVVQQKVVRSLKLRLFGSLLKQELGFFDSEASGDLMSRLTGDTVEMSENLSFVFRFSIEAVVRVVGIVGYMVFCSPRLALLTCSMVPINAVLNTYYSRWLHKNAKRSQDALAASNACAMEAISGIHVVKSFAKELFEMGKYKASVQKYYELGLLQGIVRSTYYMVIATFLMSCLVQACLVGYGAALCWRGDMKSESLVAFMLYRSQLQDQVNAILNSYTELVRGAGAADRVFALIDREPQQHDGCLLLHEDTKGTVDFEAVHFAYATRPSFFVLRGVSFRVAAEECVALVGSSASGKTSTFRLLLHLYEAQAGCVLLDGMNIKELDRSSLCKLVSIVNQEPTLFRGSVEDNIQYSQATSSLHGYSQRGSHHWWDLWHGRSRDEDREAEIRGPLRSDTEEAARMANAHDFVMHLPRGYRTEVGERGVQLSGGQRQRLAIARAVLTKPRVLLLDEATSALDNESEKVVQQALERARRGRTTMIIAHRLSTITSADRILVLEKGEVLESGSHTDLLAQKGRYHDLWSRQSSDE